MPLNNMDKQSSLYKKNIKKYEGREQLMEVIIPKLNCKWNDVVQFSSLDPQLIALTLKEFIPNLKLVNTEYYKIPILDIVQNYEAVIFSKSHNKKAGDFVIKDDEIQLLSYEAYNELFHVPDQTLKYWEDVKKNNGQYLWFNYIPHVFVKGVLNTEKFEICTLTT